VQEIIGMNPLDNDDSIAYPGYYFDPESLVQKNARGGPKGKREPREPKVKKEKKEKIAKVPREPGEKRPRKKRITKKEKKLQLRLEKKDMREKALERKKEEGVGIRGIVKFDIAKNNIANTLNNNLFEKVNLIMRVKSTF
jgi:hypothetical protein